MRRARTVALVVALSCGRAAGDAGPTEPEPTPPVRVPDGLSHAPPAEAECPEGAERDEETGECSTPGEGATYAATSDQPQFWRTKFVEGKFDKPNLVGCADGQREGFADLGRFPNVAGCLARWSGAKSLRTPRTGKVCGDDRRACTVPADACALGWHVCGANGRARDLSSRLSYDDCNFGAGPGRFNAAFSHMPDAQLVPCSPITPATDFPCSGAGTGSEPVCCGNDCMFGRCKDAAWPGRTRLSRGTAEGCGMLTSAHNGGVLCCRDPAATK